MCFAALCIYQFCQRVEFCKLLRIFYEFIYLIDRLFGKHVACWNPLCWSVYYLIYIKLLDKKSSFILIAGYLAVTKFTIATVQHTILWLNVVPIFLVTKITLTECCPHILSYLNYHLSVQCIYYLYLLEFDYIM